MLPPTEPPLRELLAADVVMGWDDHARVRGGWSPNDDVVAIEAKVDDEGADGREDEGDPPPTGRLDINWFITETQCLTTMGG